MRKTRPRLVETSIDQLEREAEADAATYYFLESFHGHPDDTLATLPAPWQQLCDPELRAEGTNRIQRDGGVLRHGPEGICEA